MQAAINYIQYLGYIGNFILAKKITRKDLYFPEILSLSELACEMNDDLTNV